jgi:leader peptidase (prepilin peptidase)/N-methyltransferase
MFAAQLVSVFVLGLVVGSFLNVCIYRLPTGDFFRSSRSFCPHCRNRIEWYDNIPLLSYLILRARCRSCAKPISPVYPLVELISGLIFAGFYWRFLLGGIHPGMYVVYLVVALALVISTFIDLKLQIIPDEITVTGVLIAPVASVIVPQLHDGPLLLSRILPQGTLPHWLAIRGDALLASVFSILVGGGTIYLLGVVGKALFKKEAMGGGDVKLMGMLGGLLGWKIVLATFFLAPFIAIPFGLVSMVRTKDHHIPYGPFLSAAALAVMIWKEWMFDLFAWWVGG